MTKSCPTIRRPLETDDIHRIVNRKIGSVKSSMKERVLVIKVEGGGDAFLRHVRSCVNH